MPAIKRVTKEDIIEGALDTLRESGFASVNARSVAKKLSCSTQPIYLSFENMEELKKELTQRAIQEHTSRVTEAIACHNSAGARYSAYGVGFVRFAQEEKQLFRYLYLESGQSGKRQDDIHLPQILRLIQEEYGYSEEIAREFHQDMAFYSYGIALLVNTDSLAISGEKLEAAFHRQFMALTSVYGIPPKHLNGNEENR